MFELTDLAPAVVSECLKGGFLDAACVVVRTRGAMTRFSNNSITLSNTFDKTVVNVYVGKVGKRFVTQFEVADPADLLRRLEELPRFVEPLKPSETYERLPSGEVSYEDVPMTYDPKIAELGERHSEIVGEIIEAARSEGAERVSGSLITGTEEVYLSTSGGRSGEFVKTFAELNVRSFADSEASGHGVAVATTFDSFDYKGAASRSGRLARMSRGAEKVEPGKYRVALSPVVVANFMQYFGMSTSAYFVDAGLSFLTDKLGKRVAPEFVKVFDDGRVPGGYASIPFDDEGVPTQRTALLDEGVLKTYLHNITTAKKYGVKSTGNAGWIVPEQHNLIIEPGDVPEDELFEALGDGIYITSNWYTRFQNFRTGEFSSVARDAVFLVKGGKLVRPLKMVRISDSIPTVFSNIEAMTRERHWVKWWDADVPTLAPHVIVKELGLTTAL